MVLIDASPVRQRIFQSASMTEEDNFSTLTFYAMGTRCRVSLVTFVGRDIVFAEGDWQGVHRLRDALAVKPIGSVYPKHIAEDRRRQRHRHLKWTIRDFQLRHSLRFAVNSADELIGPRLASFAQGPQGAEHDCVCTQHHIDVRMGLQDQRHRLVPAFLAYRIGRNVGDNVD